MPIMISSLLNKKYFMTSLCKPPHVIIIKRSTGKKTLETIAKCVGKACEKEIQQMTTAASTQVSHIATNVLTKPTEGSPSTPSSKPMEDSPQPRLKPLELAKVIRQSYTRTEYSSHDTPPVIPPSTSSSTTTPNRFSTPSTQSRGTALNTPLYNRLPHIQIRRYATVSNNAFDHSTTDPQAAVNNPSVPQGKGESTHHPEIRRNTCVLPGCNGITCVSLCSTPKDTKAVGHLTHGYPNTPASQGKVINVDANTDAKGSSEPQNAIMYTTPHTAGSTPENIQGTAFLNQPHVLAQIDKYATKP